MVRVDENYNLITEATIAEATEDLNNAIERRPKALIGMPILFVFVLTASAITNYGIYGNTWRLWLTLAAVTLSWGVAYAITWWATERAIINAFTRLAKLQ